MVRKIALLIGVGDYGAGLKSLRCPVNGVEAMRSVLSCPDIGGFDQVVTLVNPDVGEMRSRISEVFAQLTKKDLIFFYFTGHGIKDMTGEFYLTTAQSELFESGRPNAGKAVEAHFLRRELSNARAERKVVVLDCCFGAAFADGFLSMDDSSVDVEAHLGGKGWCVLTASTSTRYALEQEGEALSVYTRYLVEGMKTGGAAPDGQDFISAQNLHEYVKAQVEVAAPAMQPAIFNSQQGYEIIISKVQLNNEQRYRKQVQKKIRNGTIGPAGFAVLGQWQQRLGLSPEKARAIEDEILQPYRERQKHLALYTRALEAEKSVAYPLDEVAVQDLRDLQRLLSLRDEDIGAVEKRVLGEKVLSKKSPSSEKISSEKISSEKPSSQSPAARSSQPVSVSSALPIVDSETVSQPAMAQSYVHPSRIKAKSFARPKTTVMQFETVKVNARGEIKKQLRGEATTFTENLGNGVSLDMVRIPGGRFVMGAAKGEPEANENEYPQREVVVPGFWMGRCVVTQAQWKALMGPKAIGAQQSGNSLSATPPFEQPLKKPQQPIENIFWTDAVAFCQQLSLQTGRDYQLPSNAQWEYACRAGSTTPFHFGETLTPELANYNGNYTYGQGTKGLYRETTTEVGSFSPNAFGLYDMHGNVWEWCLDGWQTHAKALSLDATIRGLASKKKALRGGSWFYLPSNCRSAYRMTYPFHNRTDDRGFRIICLEPTL
ncbi:MAG: SUMF1/EgtB/PvdO family nonheme iron enzyme [Cyanobacteria bacterium J06554_3]